MAENDANQANYEELQGHISILGAKLKKMIPEGGGDKLEDLEDNYERLLQMRVMRNTTLEAEKEELCKELANLKRRRWMYRVGVFLLVLFLLAMQFPDEVEGILTNFTLVSHVVTGLCAVVVARLVF